MKKKQVDDKKILEKFNYQLGIDYDVVMYMKIETFEKFFSPHFCSQSMHHTDKSSQHSSIIWSNWLNCLSVC